MDILHICKGYITKWRCPLPKTPAWHYDSEPLPLHLHDDTTPLTRRQGHPLSKLIRAVVTSAKLPLGVFQDDTVCACVRCECFTGSICVCLALRLQVCVRAPDDTCKDSQLWSKKLCKTEHCVFKLYLDVQSLISHKQSQMWVARPNTTLLLNTHIHTK